MAAAIAIINLLSCSKSSTNPIMTNEVLDLNYSKNSKYVVIENKIDDTLSINQKNSNDNYIKSVKLLNKLNIRIIICNLKYS